MLRGEDTGQGRGVLCGGISVVRTMDRDEICRWEMSRWDRVFRDILWKREDVFALVMCCEAG